MDQINPTTDKKEAEISLKDIVVKTQEWLKYLLGQWKLIVLFGLLGAAIGLVYALFQKPRYKAALSFVLEDNKSNPLGAYAGIANQFGIDLGGGGGNGVFTGDNIIEFLRSRLMVEKALLTSVNVNGKALSLADLYIQLKDWDKKWDKKPALKNIRFDPAIDRNKYSLVQDSILFVLYKDILEKSLSVSKPDKKLSFVLVNCTTSNETFSKFFTERLVQMATDFYVQTKTKRSKTNVDKLQSKADSIETLLNRKTYSAAESQDLNQNPSRRVATVSAEVATRDKVVLQTMYVEVIKNLEVSKMAMAQETPIIQTVDLPILPLTKVKLGKAMGLLLGGLAGGFLILIILVVRRFYKEIMAQ